MVTGTPQATIHVWDVTTGACLATYGADSVITALALGRDRTSIIIGDDVGRLQVLQIASVAAGLSRGSVGEHIPMRDVPFRIPVVQLRMARESAAVPMFEQASAGEDKRVLLIRHLHRF